MSKISYAPHRYPPALIQRAVWLYFRFPLSFRDVEEMLAERGVDVSYESIRRWVLKFGPVIAAKIRPAEFNLQELDTLMKYLSVSVASGLICGVLWMVKERSLKSWPNLVETNK
ncbi:hypothetical protein OE750_06500 [Lentibacter sp. XHP0401]|nr:hypothetical protein [Lentibacter sp. XHP0401]MCV2892746.1 hypothetical protein [Lentibacter sp. XHP0401]